jgi:hypothetical protein
MIDESALSSEGRDRAKAMFQRLGEAEAAIHQMPVEKVHLHEVGALDSIIDIVGCVFAMEWAGADRIVCSPLNVGGGTVKSAHGVFPVPAPATLRLLGSAPVYSGAVQKELVTPTGALIATTYASSFGPIPAMSMERVGYGAGDRDDPSTPNVLRVLIGEEAAGLKACRGALDRRSSNQTTFARTRRSSKFRHGPPTRRCLEVFYIPQMKKKIVLNPVDGRGSAVAAIGDDDIIFRGDDDDSTAPLRRRSSASSEKLCRTPGGHGARQGRRARQAAERDSESRLRKLVEASNLPLKEVQPRMKVQPGKRLPDHGDRTVNSRPHPRARPTRRSALTSSRDKRSCGFETASDANDATPRTCSESCRGGARSAGDCDQMNASSAVWPTRRLV